MAYYSTITIFIMVTVLVDYSSLATAVETERIAATAVSHNPGSIVLRDEYKYEAVDTGAVKRFGSSEELEKDFNNIRILNRKRRSPTYHHTGYGLLNNGVYQNPGYGYVNVKSVQAHQQPIYYYQQQQPYTVHHYVGGGKDVINSQSQSQAISASFGSSSISGAAASAASSSNTEDHHHQPGYLYGRK